MALFSRIFDVSITEANVYINTERQLVFWLNQTRNLESQQNAAWCRRMCVFLDGLKGFRSKDRSERRNK